MGRGRENHVFKNNQCAPICGEKKEENYNASYSGRAPQSFLEKPVSSEGRRGAVKSRPSIPAS